MRSDEGEISIDEEGRHYRATWKVERGVLTVSSFDLGSKSTQVGDSPPDSLARIMLRELVNDIRTRERRR